MFRRMLIPVLALLILLPVVRVAGQEQSGNPPSDNSVQAQSAPGNGIPGRVVGDLNLRTAPDVSDDTLVRTLHNNDPVEILESVPDENGDLWYKVGESAYVYAADVR